MCDVNSTPTSVILRSPPKENTWNPPESVILGVGALREKAVARDGDVVAQLSMTLSLTFDHRVIDGAPAARFLARIRELIEQPYLLL